MCDKKQLEFYEQAAQIRKEISQGMNMARQAREKLASHIGSRAKSSDSRPQPKTPTGGAQCLYYFGDGENREYIKGEKELEKLVDLREITSFRLFQVDEQESDGSRIVADDLGKSNSWTEDYLHIFRDGTVGTMLPFYKSVEAPQVIEQGQRNRLEAVDKDLYRVLTTSYANFQSVYLPWHKEHFFMLSMIDGGNILPGEDFALVGRDSLHVTCVQNGMGENEAKALIARELGYDIGRIYFVEQPGTYHLDLNMMLLGKGRDGRERVWVAGDMKGVSLGRVHQELRGYGFDVVVDEDYTAGRAETPDANPGGTSQPSREDWETKWFYNFFNGEFVYGRNGGKLYYVTNGLGDGKIVGLGDGKAKAVMGSDVKSRFERRLREYVPKLEKVIYCNAMTVDVLNAIHGGVGCRFKGGPARPLDELFYPLVAAHREE